MAEEIIYYEPQPTDPNGYRIEAHCRPDVKRGHNIRDPQYVENRKNIETRLPHTTIIDLGPLPEAFEKIFGPSIEAYNQTQKRSDRKKSVSEYLSTFLKSREETEDKQKSTGKDRGKDFMQAQYEMQYQIGNNKNFPNRELASEILTKFVTEVFPEKWPLVRTTGAYLHNDEFSVDEKTKDRIRSPSQIHHDIVFTAESLNAEERKDFKKFKAAEKERMKKEAELNGEEFDEAKWKTINWQRICVERYGKPLATGLPLQCSMSACLAQMGYFTEKGKGTAQQQWEEDVRHTLQDFAESYGLKIDRTLGPKHKHMTTDEWQIHEENKKKEQELSKLEKKVNADKAFYTTRADEIRATAKQAEEDKKIAEKKDRDADFKLGLAETKESSAKTKEESNKLVEKRLQIREEIADDREKDLDDRENELDNREKDLDDKKSSLDERESDLDKKEKDINQKEEENEAEHKRFLDGFSSIDELKADNNRKTEEIKNLYQEINNNKVFKEAYEYKMIYNPWHEEELNELKPFKAAKISYVSSHNLEDCKNMFESFMNGIQSVVEMLYQMCLKWTPAHLRNLANKIEKAGCKNLVEYRKYVKNHSYGEDYEVDR